MGIHDRDYYQDERSGGVHLGSEWSVVTKLIVVNVVVFVADIFTQDRFLMSTLAAHPSSVTEPWWIWQLLTYGFAHGDERHIFWNMFMLFVFGRDVEAVYGGKEFVRIYLVTIVLGGLLWALRELFTLDPALWNQMSLVGASGAVTAVTMLFCLRFPKRTILLMFILPVPAWVLGLLVIVGNVMTAFSETNVAVDVHLVGALFAICYHRLGWNLSRWTVRVPKTQLFKTRPKLKLHDPEVQYGDLDAEGDRLLEKVRQEGIDSLSSTERSTLEDYSRRMRQKHS